MPKLHSRRSVVLTHSMSRSATVSSLTGSQDDAQSGKGERTAASGRPLTSNVGPHSMLKLMGWGNRPWMEFEIDPLSGRYVKRRLKSHPTWLHGYYAGFGQELKVSGLGIVLCSVFKYEGEISMHMGSAAWNLFEPGLEIAHRDGTLHCELSVVDASGKQATFRYRRKDTLLLIIDSTYDDLDFESANLPANLPSWSRRNKAELVEAWLAPKTMLRLEQWQEMWKGLGAASADHALFHELLDRYSENHRRYHTLQHLEECFTYLAQTRSLAEHPHEVALALWFHDAIYDVRRQDNEQKSAEWVKAAALRSGLASSVAERVYDLVMVTRHQALPEGTDAKLLVDIDLAILGAAAPRFDEYEFQVREEYAGVPRFLFRRKRRKILEEFIARPRIFNTDHFFNSHEAIARLNLERSLEKLGG